MKTVLNINMSCQSDIIRQDSFVTEQYGARGGRGEDLYF